MTKIIKATKQDLDQICQLFNEYDKDIEKHFPKNHLKLLQKLHTQHGDNPQRRKNVMQAMVDKKQLFLVAKEDEKIVGCVIGWIESNYVGKFDQLILSSQSKKKEILNQLYNELEKWFKVKKCLYVIVNVVTNNPRKKLYKTLGFDSVLEEMRKII
ncbi:MAG: GNAT family N-acetyltransferase [Melioribacteraceae bacterium]